jgi:hypothetical protein
MASRFPGIPGHQGLEFALCLFVFGMRSARPRKDPGEFCPGIGATHIDDTDRLDPRLGRFDAE